MPWRILAFLMPHSTPLLFKLAPRSLTTPISRSIDMGIGIDIKTTSLIEARRTRAAAVLLLLW